MGYVQDYNDSAVNKKIPYDDIPISRDTPTIKRRGGSGYQKSASPLKSKFIIGLVVIMFVMNIVMCFVTFYYAKHSVTKQINYYTYDGPTQVSNSINPNSINSAIWSSVTVKAGSSSNSLRTSNGGGIIYKVDNEKKVAYFITCFHVIDGYSSVSVLLPSQINYIPVQVVGFSRTYDLAVLRTKSVSDFEELDGARAVEQYNSTYLSYGERVFAVGNPLSAGMSITSGIISRLNITINTSLTNSIRVLQIDAAINAGNSGGGLYNDYGEFIGIVDAKRYTSNDGSSLNDVVEATAFAIPSTVVAGIADSIIYNNGVAKKISLDTTFDHNLLGGVSNGKVKDQHGDDKNVNKYVVQVYGTPSGIASGVLKRDDVIKTIKYTNLNGKEIEVEVLNKYFFEDVCFSIKPESRITLTIERGGREMSVEFNARSYTQIN